MRRLPAECVRTNQVIAIFQDFSGGLSAADLSNLAHTVIHNIANLHDHLRRWAVRNGHDKTTVDSVLDGSDALKLIKDLSNNDKHGYPPRDGGHSTCAPRLLNIRREMRLTTKPEAGSSVAMTLGPGGVPKISGTGTACAIITADVVDEAGNPRGDLFSIAKKAVETWEGLLSQLQSPAS